MRACYYDIAMTNLFKSHIECLLKMCSFVKNQDFLPGLRYLRDIRIDGACVFS